MWADLTRDKIAMAHGPMLSWLRAEGGSLVGPRDKEPMDEGSRAGGLRA